MDAPADATPTPQDAITLQQAAAIFADEAIRQSAKTSSRSDRVPDELRRRKPKGMTAEGVRKLIARGELTAVANRGRLVTVSRKQVLATITQRREAATARLRACKVELAKLLSAGHDATTAYKKLREKHFSKETIRAARKSLKIKSVPGKAGVSRKWVMPGQAVEAAERDTGEVFTDAKGQRWLTDGQLQALHGAKPTLARQWAKRKSKLRPTGQALRSRMVPRPAHYPPGPKKVRGYLEADWLAIAAGKEYRRWPGEGPGPVHARLYEERIAKAQQALAQLIPKGSSAKVDTVRAELAAKGIDWRAAKTAFATLGGTKTSTTEAWRASQVRGRKQWWWSLPDSAYERPLSSNGPPVPGGTVGLSLGTQATTQGPPVPAVRQPFTPFVPSPFQERILRALEGKALSVANLRNALNVDNGTLYGRGLRPLKEAGLIANHPRIGYFRWDALPPKYAKFLAHHPKFENLQNNVPAV